MKALATVLQFFPFVLEAVKAVEDNYAAEPGANKKKIVLDSVLAAARIGESVPEPTIALISALVDSTVTALNTAGIFSHKPPAAPTQPTAPANPQAAK